MANKSSTFCLNYSCQKGLQPTQRVPTPLCDSNQSVLQLQVDNLVLGPIVQGI